jgi:hypothetical protein
MTDSLRDLLRQDADRVEIPTLDAGDVISQGEQRLHRRRVTAVLASVAAVAVIAVGGIVAGSVQHRSEGPVDKPNDKKTNQTDEVQTRRLTYAVGSTIHWGDSAIDVGQTVEAVGATDDGVVFVRGDKACPYGVACRTLWFTDGAEPVRLGTVAGDWVRGWGVELAGAGSTVVWSESETDAYVVYDTTVRHEVGRFGSARGTLLAVGDRSVYWVPDERRQCVEFDGRCMRYKDPIIRFDVTTGKQTKVPWESYWATRRSWSRTLMSPPHGYEISGTSGTHVVRPPHADPELNDKYGFRLEGTRLLGDDYGIEVSVRLAQTGQPLQVRIPAGYPSGSYFGISQWLDDNHVVMWYEDGALLVCPVPDGRCRTMIKHGAIISFAGHG